MNDTFMFALPGELTLAGDRLVVFDRLQPDAFFHLFDKATGRPLGSFGRKGKAKGEVLNPYNTAYDPASGMIVTYDIMQKKIVSYRLDDVVGDVPVPYVEEIRIEPVAMPAQVLPWHDSFWILGYTDAMRFGRVDRDGRIGSIYGEFPELVEDEEENWSVMSYATCWKMRPDGSRMVQTTYIGTVMELLDVGEDGIRSNAVVRISPPVNYQLAQGAVPKWVTHTPETIAGFADLSVTEDRIYGLLYDVTIEEYDRTVPRIVVFDWEGRARAIYQPDEILVVMAVDAVSNTLYGIVRTEEGFALKRYALPAEG